MAKVDKYNIVWMDSVDSTNDEIKRNMGMLDNLTVIVSKDQTAGRGQRGNVWLTKPGMNLTFSIVLKYEQMCLRMKALDQFAISEMTALSVIDLLARYGIDARIKLPNDIYVGDKKICGILIEHSLQGEYLSHSIVGIGLNVNQVVFDPSLPDPTSMLLCRPDCCGQFSLEVLLNQFMDIFCGYLQKMQTGEI